MVFPLNPLKSSRQIYWLKPNSWVQSQNFVLDEFISRQKITIKNLCDAKIRLNQASAFFSCTSGSLALVRVCLGTLKRPVRGFLWPSLSHPCVYQDDVTSGFLHIALMLVVPHYPGGLLALRAYSRYCEKCISQSSVTSCTHSHNRDKYFWILSDHSLQALI